MTYQPQPWSKWGHAPLDIRIKRSVRQDERGCWIWQLRTQDNRGGYGLIQVNGKRAQAHRVAYETFVGPIPDGLTLDHICRRPACVNPEHLRPMSRSENSRGGALSLGLCRSGRHVFDGANVYVLPNGKRRCRACGSEASRRYHAEKRKRSQRWNL